MCNMTISESMFSIARKEEEVSTDPTFEVSVIFGKRDEVNIRSLCDLPFFALVQRALSDPICTCSQ